MNSPTAQPDPSQSRAEPAHDLRGAWLRFSTELNPQQRDRNREFGDVAKQVLDAVQKLPKIVGAALLEASENDERLVLTCGNFDGPVFERPAFQSELKSSAQRAFANKRLQIVPSSEIRNLTTLVYPFGSGSHFQTGIALAIATPADELTFEVVLPQLIALELQRCSVLHEQQELHLEVDALAAILEIVAEISTADSTTSAAHSLASELHNYLECSFVAIGLTGRRTSKIRLTALSEQASFERRTEFARDLESVFAECVLHSAVTAFPFPTEQQRFPAHAQFAKARNLDSLVCVPLNTADERCVGVLAIVTHEGSGIIPPGRLPNVLTCLREPVGSAIALVRRSQRGWVSRLIRPQETVGWRRCIVISIALIILAMFVPLPYRISTHCVVEPTLRRFSVAPHAGLLRITHAQPGDIVEADQLLAEMDGRETDWELAGLAAEQHQAARERDAHLANRSIADAELARLEMQRLAIKSKLVQYRRDNLEIRSPIAGIVLSGSLDRRENYPVRQGEGLYEIAPLDPLRIELAVPDADIPHVESGMPIHISLDGDDDSILQAQVDRIRPRSEIRDGENVFVADVSIPNSSGRLRPGMQGTARIVSHHRKLGWILFHKPWRAIRNFVGF